MGETFSNLGDAHKAAQKYANRDDCKWHIWRNESSVYPYTLLDEFTNKPYSFYKLAATVEPASATPAVIEDRHTITLNDEELELVKLIFKDKFDPAREFYAGSEEAKDSLFKKVCKALTGG